MIPWLHVGHGLHLMRDYLKGASVLCFSGLLFDAKALESGWIRLGGVLFATFGMQYLGTALIDWRTAHSSSHSIEGLPDMPFRPATPHGDSHNSKDSSSAAAGNNHRDKGSRAQQHLRRSNRTAVQDHPTISAAEDRVAGAGVTQRSRAGQPALGIYNEPPSVSSSSSSGAGSSDLSASATDQHHHAGVHHLSWLCSSTGFFEASVWSRLMLAVLFCVLVVVGECQVALLLLAVLNLLGALGMMNALKQQWCLHVMGDLPAAAEHAC